MEAIDILHQHKLKRTPCREGIIDVVKASAHALSENEIRDKLLGNFDRTTFYRSFKTLVEHKIVHKIVVDNQHVRYALDHDENHEEVHAHFFCKQCHTVSCMESVPVQKYALPDGYSNEATEVLIKGTCALCKDHN